MNMEDDGDISKVAISKLQAKEEEIERKKLEVREKVELQLGRAEEQTRRLAHIWEVSACMCRSNYMTKSCACSRILSVLISRRCPKIRHSILLGVGRARRSPGEGSRQCAEEDRHC